MQKKISTLLACLFLLSFLSCRKPLPDKVIPDSIYQTSSHFQKSPLGKWKYANNQFFEFTGTPEEGNWEFYFDFGQGKQVQFSGKWKVYHFQDEKASGLLRLDYEKIGLGNPQILDPKTNLPTHQLYPVKRWQVTEFYADDNYFGMNVYFKKDDSTDFFGTWTHANYDWFDDFYFWSESPLWLNQEEFEKNILAKIEDKNKKEFFKENYMLKLGKYYRDPKISEDNISQLSQIMEQVREKNGYRGDWFYTPLSSIPGYEAYYINRLGEITFNKKGKLTYKGRGGYFKESLGDVCNGLPVLTPPKSGNNKETARFEVWEIPLQDKYGIEDGSEVHIKFYESSNPNVIWDWEFKAIILKDKNILISFPFEKVKE